MSIKLHFITLGQGTQSRRKNQ